MRCALLLSGAALLLGGCDGGNGGEDRQKEVPKALATAPVAAGPPVENRFGTPVKDRVATVGVLNKRNNLTQNLILKSGEAKRLGNLVVRLATCERTLPWEQPAETGGFVQVFVEERAKADAPLAWRQVFSGWLFKNSPSLNMVEHPVYDVWIKDCTMKFPGEEETPRTSASASSAANAAGKASTPPAAAKPSPAPAPSPSPSPEVAGE